MGTKLYNSKRRLQISKVVRLSHINLVSAFSWFELCFLSWHYRNRAYIYYL